MLQQTIEANNFISLVGTLGGADSSAFYDILRPSLDDEALLRDLHEAEPDHPRLRNSLVGLIDVFALPGWAKQSYPRPTVHADDLDRCYILPLSAEQRIPAKHRCIVSKRQFCLNWKRFSGDLLLQMNDWDWDNVVVAGGAVVVCLKRHVPLRLRDGNVNGIKNEDEYTSWPYENSDIDLYLWGLSPSQMYHKIRVIHQAMCASGLGEIRCRRTPNTLSFYVVNGESQYRTVQVILRCYSSPSHILSTFDIDCTRVLYDGDRVLATPRCMAAMMRQANLIDLDCRSLTYEIRIIKYGLRAFEGYYPLLQRSKVNETIVRGERDIPLANLALLLHYEYQIKVLEGTHMRRPLAWLGSKSLDLKLCDDYGQVRKFTRRPLGSSILLQKLQENGLNKNIIRFIEEVADRPIPSARITDAEWTELAYSVIPDRPKARKTGLRFPVSRSKRARQRARSEPLTVSA